jgi:GDPmannose 4,6-dehydratase
MKKALVTGVTGQDGSYLAELLVLEKDYKVDGLVRRLSTPNYKNLVHIKNHNHFNLIEGDLEDSSRIASVIESGQYDEVYNLGAMSFVKYSFDNPVQTTLTNYIGCINLVDSIIRSGNQNTKYYQASTSEMYGGVGCPAQGYTEDSAFHPRSPYGIAKLAAYWHTRNARDAGQLFACNGILFNHESPRRGIEFVTQKIVDGLVKYDNWRLGNTTKRPPILQLGNLDAMRDWGHADDYVNAMYLMMQQLVPSDYVVATQREHSVRDFISTAARALNFHITWEGEGVNEVGKDSDGKCIIRINTDYYRPIEVDCLIGDPSKVKSIGWVPEYGFEELVEDMIEHKYEEIRSD